MILRLNLDTPGLKESLSGAQINILGIFEKYIKKFIKYSINVLIGHLFCTKLLIFYLRTIVIMIYT